MTPRPEDAPAAIAATPAALRATAVATTAAACSPPGDQSTSTPPTTDAKWGQIRPSRWGQRKSSFSTASGTHDPVLLARAALESPQLNRVRDQLAARVWIVPWQVESLIGEERLAALSNG